jgi:polar amino acid transport system ATP-binding protein/sulfate transport system ATP-binding protein
MPTYDTNQILEFHPGQCSCDPLADEHCEVCRLRHRMVGQAVMPYQKDGPLLSVEGVSMKYGNRVILQNVNIKIRKMTRSGLPTGRIVSFLGPSGIGKSVMLRLLAGLEKPTIGNIFINSNRVPVKAGLVGLVMQYYPLFRHRTVLSNLIIAAKQSGLSKATNSPLFKPETRAKEMLNRFGLLNKAEDYPIQLSGGQRQRISIMQQLLCSDHYLLMDEPTSGLDPISKKNICSLITEVSNSGDGVTIIIVTHDIQTAVTISDTIWLMGRDRDATGNIISGARIIDTYDLIECGLCWSPKVRIHPAYSSLIQELEGRFDTL